MEERVLEILADINEETVKVGLRENLLSAELLDSIEIMELVDELEKQFEIEIQPEELELNNFATKEKIVCFIKRKKADYGGDSI